jgi:cytochrome P450
MKSYGALIEEVTAARMRDRPADGAIELQDEFQHITLDVILRAVFGFDGGPAMADARKHIQRWLTMLASPASMVPFLRNNFGPGRSWTPARLVRNQVDKALYALIAEHRTDARIAEREDVLSMLIQARDEDGQAMTDQELRDELITLLLAGHETTATALAWALYELGKDPSALARAREAADAGDDDHLEAVLK